MTPRILFLAIAIAQPAAVLVARSAIASDCAVILHGDGIHDDSAGWQAILEGRPNIRWSDGTPAWKGRILTLQGRRLLYSPKYPPLIPAITAGARHTLVSHVVIEGQPIGDGSAANPYSLGPPYFISRGFIEVSNFGPPAECGKPTS